jgi:hypothetical protein
MKQISFSASKQDYATIKEIATRAALMAREHGVDYDFLSAQMDITATHCSGNPLRLSELLAADRLNFSHDVFGIRRHLDRSTGELTDCFVPRFSQPSAAVAA